VLVDRVHVLLLTQRLRPDGPPATGQDVEREHVSRALGRALFEHADRAPYSVGGQCLTLLNKLQKFGEDRSALALSAGAPEIVISLPRTWMSLAPIARRA
jgi:hypothetical protein